MARKTEDLLGIHCRSQAAGCRLLKEAKFATSEPGGPALDAVETQDVPIWGQDR